MLLVLAGAILSATGAFVATLREKHEKLASATQRAQFESELREKSDKIAALNEKIAASVTGGDNYCHVEFVDINKVDAVMLTVVNEGKWPAYDVVVRISDLLKIQEDKKALPEHLAALATMETTFQKTLGTIPSMEAVMLRDTPLMLPQANVAVFAVQVGARNGTVAQVIRFQRVNGAWTFATKATLANATDVVWQYIGPNYPQKDIEGSEWWKGP